jgi:antitoxin (DNA-binding transcriptional repressor) of toxin-antitoxin stability system
MGKMVGVTEFKAKCLRILDELERTREPVTITKRGRIIGELHPPKPKKKFEFGFLAHPDYRFDEDAVDQPAYDKPWNAELGIID